MFFKSVLLLLALGSVEATFFDATDSCVMPRINHGRVRLRQRSRLARFSCMPRYELVGNKYATCRGGRWDVPIPACVRPTCPVPELQNGLRMVSHSGAWVIFFCFPNHELVGSPAIYCDGYKWNATAPTCVDSTISPKLSCDFEDPDLCGWKQDSLHDFDWLRLNSKTPSALFFTGPSYDHTLGIGKDGHYMYIESTSHRPNDTARLISPIYETSLAQEGCFTFSYHMYGKTCGGLRVYQKPDNLTLKSMLELPEVERQTYVLFEKWGNLGDTWFNGVSHLNDFSVDFQIIIEGIRGTSYTSDIAIDDVAILHGVNCTAAFNTATTPSTPTTTVTSDSCLNRCIDEYVTRPPSNNTQCSCSFACFVEQTCCLDFFDVCVYPIASTETDANSSATVKSVSEEAPQTQKLVAVTTESTTSTTTSTSTTTAKPTTQRRTTTARPTTTTTPKPRTTTPKPTSPPTTTPSTTTPKTTTKLITSSKPTTTYKTTSKPTTYKPTTKSIPVTIKATPLTSTIATTKKITTTSSYKVSKPIDNDNYLESVEKEKEKVKEVIENMDEEKKKVFQEVKVLPQTRGMSSSGKVVTIILVLATLTALAMVVHAGFRSTRLRIVLARFRGHRDRDPEVRYLSSDVDDDC